MRHANNPHSQSQQHSGGRGRVQNYQPQRAAYDPEALSGWPQTNSRYQDSPYFHQPSAGQAHTQTSRNQADSPDLKITTVVSNPRKASDAQSSQQAPRYGNMGTGARNPNMMSSGYGNDSQRVYEQQPQSLPGYNSARPNQRGYNNGPPPGSNDQPLNLNFPRDLAHQGRVAPASARNPNAQTAGNRGGPPNQFSPYSGNSGMNAHPLSSDDEMGNLDEGYDRPPSQYQQKQASPQERNREPQAAQASERSGARVTRMSAAGRGPQPAGPSQRSQLNQSTNTVDPKPQDLQKIQEELRMLEREKEKRDYERQRHAAKQTQPQSMEPSMQMQRQEPVADAYKSDNFGEEEADEEQSLQMAQPQQDVDPRHSRELQPKREVKSKALPQNYWTQPNNEIPKPEMMNEMPEVASQPADGYPEGDGEPAQPNEMYNELYHRVMQSKSPARILNNKVSSFEVYKDGWNSLQDRMDKGYQRQLRKINHEAAKRMQDAQERQEYKLQQNALKYKQQHTDQLMEECTFSPRIEVSYQARKYRDRVGNRSGKAFHDAQDRFAAKKSNNLKALRTEKEKESKQMQIKQFMNPGSKKILRDNSRTLSKSASHNQFLERNYYGVKDKSASRITSADVDKSDTSRTRDLSASHKYVRDISGSKISFLNSTSQVYGKGKATYSAAGERLFSPKINDRSKLMSPRDKDSTFYMLHQQAINQQRKQYIREYQAEREAQLMANRGVQDIVNGKSDAYLAKQFYNEFCQVIEAQIESSNQIYLVDVLDQLHFISEDKISKQSVKLNALLKQSKRTLYIDTEAGQFQGESEDITKNLFKICCAILNLRPKQRGQNPLDDYVLKRYLDQIQDAEGPRETLIIEQLQVIKSIVNRKAFSLSDRQIILINRKFHNMSVHRKGFLFSQRKAEGLDKVHAETQPLFSPRINAKSRALDRSETRPDRSKKRTDQMYAYAAKYDQHKTQLRQAMSNQELAGVKFEPQLNAKSVRLVQGTQRSFTDRTMGQYLNKHKRQDRDPNQIEFERQQQECTFKPTITSSRPTNAGRANGSRSPITRGRQGNVINKKKASPEKKIAPQPVMQRNLQISQSTPMVQEQHLDEIQPSPPPPMLQQFQNRQVAPQMKNNQPNGINNGGMFNPPMNLPMQHNGYQLPMPNDSYSKEEDEEEEEEQQQQQQQQQVDEVVEEEDEEQNQDENEEEDSEPNYDEPQQQQQDSAEPLQKQRPSPEKNHEKPILPPVQQQFHAAPPQRNMRINRPLPSFLPVVEEPICVLKIELDGEHIEEIKVFENDDPNEIVQKFGNDFNLSQNARQRLLEQIQEQIQMDEDDD